MPQSIADEALLLISGRRQQREAKEPKESAPLIDTVMAAKMLRLCGIGAMDPVILCAYGNTNKFVPDPCEGPEELRLGGRHQASQERGASVGEG